MTALILLGSGAVCSDYMSLIAKPNFDCQFAEAVTDWLSENIRPGGPLGRIDVIELEGVCLQHENTQYLFELLQASGFKSHTVELEGCWALELPASWDELNASFSKSLRRKTKKAVMRLEQAETRILTTDETELSELWPQFVDLHQKRRQMLGQPGCFADSKFVAFLFEAMHDLIQAGRGEVVVINHAGRPFASFLLLNDSETVYMYQSGMDPETISLEPGYQIAILAMQRSMQKKFRRFDFLRGDEPYKSRWLTERIPLARTRFIPRNLTSQLKHSIWQTGHSIKQYLKQPGPTQESDS